MLYGCTLVLKNSSKPPGLSASHRIESRLNWVVMPRLLCGNWGGCAAQQDPHGFDHRQSWDSVTQHDGRSNIQWFSSPMFWGFQDISKYSKSKGVSEVPSWILDILGASRLWQMENIWTNSSKKFDLCLKCLLSVWVFLLRGSSCRTGAALLCWGWLVAVGFQVWFLCPFWLTSCYQELISQQNIKMQKQIQVSKTSNCSSGCDQCWNLWPCRRFPKKARDAP